MGRGARRLTRRFVLAGGASAAVAGCASAPSEVIAPPEAAIRVATFNIEYVYLTARRRIFGSTEAEWAARRAGALAALRRINADVIAFQEMETWAGLPQEGPPIQRQWLSARMPGFGIAAIGAGEGRETGQPIMYRLARFVALADGAVALGGQPGDGAPFAGYSDMVTWAQLRDRITGEGLRVINLHLHFRDGARRRSGARLAAAMAAEALSRGERVIVLGDLNATPLMSPVNMLREAGLADVPLNGATYHFGRGWHVMRSIDHIFHGPGLQALGDAQMLRGQYDGVWPSDHYPVWADFRYR